MARWINPYYCIGPRGSHEPTGDNPMPTGHCLVCNAFIGRTRKGWRTCTKLQATMWGLYEYGHFIATIRRKWRS
jgi:hypothetical protein